jgi:hypothetical protein
LAYLNICSLASRFLLRSTNWGEAGSITMQEVEVADFARQLFQAHGPKAAAEAAQKARALEEQGKADEATTWRRIKAAIKEMLGPHQS